MEQSLTPEKPVSLLGGFPDKPLLDTQVLEVQEYAASGRRTWCARSLGAVLTGERSIYWTLTGREQAVTTQRSHSGPGTAQTCKRP